MRTVLHVVRRTPPPVEVAEHDWVVYLDPTRLVQGGAPHTAPFPLGPVDHDQVVALAFAADLVVTW
jgi:hypothetical protein